MWYTWQEMLIKNNTELWQRERSRVIAGKSDSSKEVWLSSGLITCEPSDSAPQCLFIGLQPAICFSFTFAGNPLRPIKSELNLPDFHGCVLKVREAGGWLFKSPSSWINLAARGREKRCSLFPEWRKNQFHNSESYFYNSVCRFWTCLVWQDNSPADRRRNQILSVAFHLKYSIIETHSFSLFLVSEYQYKFIILSFGLNFPPIAPELFVRILIFSRSCLTKFQTNILTSSYLILDFLSYSGIVSDRFGRLLSPPAVLSECVCGKVEQSAECFLKCVCIHMQGDGGLLRESPPLSPNSRVQFSQCCFVYWSAVN